MDLATLFNKPFLLVSTGQLVYQESEYQIARSHAWNVAMDLLLIFTTLYPSIYDIHDIHWCVLNLSLDVNSCIVTNHST